MHKLFQFKKFTWCSVLTRHLKRPFTPSQDFQPEFTFTCEQSKCIVYFFISGWLTTIPKKITLVSKTSFPTSTYQPTAESSLEPIETEPDELDLTITIISCIAIVVVTLIFIMLLYFCYTKLFKRIKGFWKTYANRQRDLRERPEISPSGDLNSHKTTKGNNKNAFHCLGGQRPLSLLGQEIGKMSKLVSNFVSKLFHLTQISSILLSKDNTVSYKLDPTL